MTPYDFTQCINTVSTTPEICRHRTSASFSQHPHIDADATLQVVVDVDGQTQTHLFKVVNYVMRIVHVLNEQ